MSITSEKIEYAVDDTIFEGIIFKPLYDSNINIKLFISLE